MRKKNFTVFIGLFLFSFTLFTSCDALSIKNDLDGTAWFTEAQGGYREDLVLAEDGTFSWIQSVDGAAVDTVTGSYETSVSVLNNISYANIRLIITDQDRAVTLRFYIYPTEISMMLMGIENTVYYKVIEEPVEEPAEEAPEEEPAAEESE